MPPTIAKGLLEIARGMTFRNLSIAGTIR